MKDGQRKMRHCRRPRLGEGLLGRRDRGDVGLDKVAVACGGGIIEHVLARKRSEVNDADARRRLTALEKLEDDVAAYEACMPTRMREVGCFSRSFFS